MAHNESRRFINNCLSDKSEKNLTSASLLVLLWCSCFRKDQKQAVEIFSSFFVPSCCWVALKWCSQSAQCSAAAWGTFSPSSWCFHAAQWMHLLQIITVSATFCRRNREDCRLTGRLAFASCWKDWVGGWRSSSKCPTFFVLPLGVF